MSHDYDMLIREQQISVADIEPNMVLTRDVVTGEGSIFLLKGTMLNSANCSKLKDNGVEYVFVNTSAAGRKKRKPGESEEPSEESGEIVTRERQSVPVEERKDFKVFVKTYEEKRDEAKKYLLAISDGATVNLRELFTLTDGIMSRLKCKSDVFTFISYIKDNNEHTYTHSNNVALLANLFGHWLGLSEEDMVYLTAAGLLHDVGKTKTPPEILNKKGRLTDEEFVVMKKHTVEGYNILRNQNIPEEIKLGALLHHERIDGTGYPLGVKSERINKLSKIISICDIYDAMTANRVYRDKICPFEVIRTFETKVYGELDTEFLLVFLRNIAYSYIGNWVRLSDGRDAEVMFINRHNLSRPIVRATDGDVIDLSQNNDLNISALI